MGQAARTGCCGPPALGGVCSIRVNYPAVLLVASLALAGCGSSQTISGSTTTSTRANSTSSGGIPEGHPQAIEPNAGVQGTTSDPTDPVGDANAHAPPLSEVKHLLQLELIAASADNASYIDPLRFVTVWERTDQGVDAQLPVGAPILAPCRVKILAIEPDWYAGQPLVYFELAPRARCRPGAIRRRADHRHRPARQHPPAGPAHRSLRPVGHGDRVWLVDDRSGSRWPERRPATRRARSRPQGRSMRNWLNSLGANAGPSY